MSASDPKARRPEVISLADEEGVKQVLVNSVLGLSEVVNDLTRLRASRRDRYRVTIFGRAAPDEARQPARRARRGNPMKRGAEWR